MIRRGNFARQEFLTRKRPTSFAGRASVRGLLTVGLLLLHAPFVAGQVTATRGWSDHIIVPQCRSITMGSTPGVSVTHVSAQVRILEQTARTTLTITVKNATLQRQTAEVLLPVPLDSVIHSFAMGGGDPADSQRPTAKILNADEARLAFQQIVARLKDPALLEFVNLGLVRSSVFPVEPNAEQKVELTYESILPRDGGRVDYVLPRSGSVAYRIPWDIQVEVHAKQGLASVYSPSHPLESSRVSESSYRVQVAEASRDVPGPFRLSYLVQDKEVSASLLTFANPAEKGGYFLLLAGLNAASVDSDVPREVTLVLDRSGSMKGHKIEQAREAALQIVHGLRPGESFNLIAYNNEIQMLSQSPLVKSDDSVQAAEAFLNGLTAVGGTNIHEALLKSLAQPTPKEALPLVIFLTDGLPTVGQTSETEIRRVATEQNPSERRIFTFGVGVDVNSPLLDKIARETRAFATFVLPDEDVEAKIGKVFSSLNGPQLGSPELHVVNAEGQLQKNRLREMQPRQLNDLFAGDQLVILGKYRGKKPLRFQLAGKRGGREVTYQFELPVRPSLQNDFVARLWAGRRIGELTDQIRDMGAATPKVAESSVKELVDEIVRISTEFGILTEYTAFLAQEGADLADTESLQTQARDNYVSRAVGARSGALSVNQELNNAQQRSMACVNLDNRFWNANLQRVSIATVQQVGDKAFYRRAGRWIDSSLLDQTQSLKPTRTIEQGSPEHLELILALSRRNQQSCAALVGDVYVLVDGETIRIRDPHTRESQQQSQQSEVAPQENSVPNR